MVFEMREGENVILVIGPPGSGKSTIAELVANRLQLDTFSSGDVLRRIAASKGRSTLHGIVRRRMERSLPMPIGIFCEIVRRELVRKHDSGVVFDGFPRTAEQSSSIEQIMRAVNLVPAKVTLIVLHAPKTLLRQRVLGRAVCGKCGATRSEHTISCVVPYWHQRDDDTDTQFTTRYEDYRRSLPAILDNLSRRISWHQVDATESIERVADSATQLTRSKI